MVVDAGKDNGFDDTTGIIIVVLGNGLTCITDGDLLSLGVIEVTGDIGAAFEDDGDTDSASDDDDDDDDGDNGTASDDDIGIALEERIATVVVTTSICLHVFSTSLHFTDLIDLPLTMSGLAHTPVTS